MTQADQFQNHSCGDHIQIQVRRRQKRNSNTDRVYQDNNHSKNKIHNQLGTWCGIKIAHTNINSIRYNLDQLYAELHNYDIICVSETKLNPLIRNQDLELNGFFTPIRKDGDLNNGGGLIIYVKRNVHFIRRHDLESTEIENIWIEVTSLRKKFLLVLFYRPPNSLSEYWE